MKLAQILFSQGCGTRRACAGLLAHGLVADAQGQVLQDPDLDLPVDGLVLHVQGQPWPVHLQALLMLHKPAGVECSQKPGRWPSVMGLLPAPLRQRGVQPVGRLDVDTTGLLLLTDNGALLHRLTSPRHHVPKVYQVHTARPVDDTQVARLCSGVPLKERFDKRDSDEPVRALAARATGPSALELVLDEGRYHQVKRMVAAVGNHVQGLHRSQVGGLPLPDTLAPGQWQWLDAAQRQALLGTPTG
jgi:16S rRNA pseudouridine516 synthase